MSNNTPKLQLEHGKKYVTEAGTVVTVDRNPHDTVYLFRGRKTGYLYTATGQYFSDKPDSRDLIKEYIPELQLEVGKTYERADGVKATITGLNDGKGGWGMNYTHIGDDNEAYMRNGQFFYHRKGERDLIREVQMSPAVKQCVQGGKTYTMRNGETVEIISDKRTGLNGLLHDKYVGISRGCVLCFYPTGEYDGPVRTHKFDIIFPSAPPPLIVPEKTNVTAYEFLARAAWKGHIGWEPNNKDNSIRPYVGGGWRPKYYISDGEYCVVFPSGECRAMTRRSLELDQSLDVTFIPATT